MKQPASQPPFDENLASWLHPISLDEFRTKYWRLRALSITGSAKRLTGLQTALGSFELRDLLCRARDPLVSAWYVDEGKPDFSLSVPIDVAYRLYRAGLTIYFHLKDDVFEMPILRSFCAALAQPARHARLSIFATRLGKRTPAHVDGNENITVQLTGRKRWRYGFDPAYRVPIENWTPDGFSAPRLQSTDLTPGSLLYLPGRWQHETEDLADSVSLNICFPNTTWATYLGPALTRALERDVRWSKEASSLHEGTPEALESARTEAAALACSLADHLTLDPEALLQRRFIASAILPNSRFRRSPHASASVLRGADGNPRLVIQSAWQESVLGLDSSALELCAWIGRRSSFTFAEARQSCHLNFKSTREVVTSLAESGYILPCVAQPEVERASAATIRRPRGSNRGRRRPERNR